MKLKDVTIRNAKAKESPYKLADGRGLYIQITPSGGKLWRWDYRHDDKRKTMALGNYPDVPLALARERHAAGRSLLATGTDPMSRRKESKVEEKIAQESAFANIAAKWMEHWRHGKSVRYVDSTRRRIDTNIRRPSETSSSPRSPRPISLAWSKPSKIAGRATSPSELSKQPAKSFGSQSLTATRSAILPQIFAHPMSCRRYSKPTTHVSMQKSFRISLRQIQVYRGRHVTRIATQLLALTFVRTGELIAAKWSEFDFDNARWDIPKERMKMRVPHIVPLSQQTLDSLAELHTLTGTSEWLFPGEGRSKTHMSNNTILKGLERMGYKGTMTGHGFRGLASTILHEQDYPHDHIELQLAHTPRNAVSAAYNHAQYLKPRAKMMQDWGDFLDAQRRGAKVLQMETRPACSFAS